MQANSLSRLSSTSSQIVSFPWNCAFENPVHNHKEDERWEYTSLLYFCDDVKPLTYLTLYPHYRCRSFDLYHIWSAETHSDRESKAFLKSMKFMSNDKSFITEIFRGTDKRRLGHSMTFLFWCKWQSTASLILPKMKDKTFQITDNSFTPLQLLHSVRSPFSLDVLYHSSILTELPLFPK